MKFIIVLCPSKKNAEALCQKIQASAGESTVYLTTYENCVRKLDYQTHAQYDYVLAYGLTSGIDSHTVYGHIIRIAETKSPKGKNYIDLAVFCNQPKGMTLPAKLALERLKVKSVYIPADVEKDGTAAIDYINENTN